MGRGWKCLIFLFVDDTLIFYDANPIKLKYMSWVFI